MPLDPRDYDLSELRDTEGDLSLEEVAAGGPTSRRIDRLDDRPRREEPPGGPPNPPGSRSEEARSIRRELSILERATGAPLERPYLDSIPGHYDAETLAMEWIDAMLDAVGISGVRSALRFYRSVGWISRDVEETLMDHAAGLSGDANTAGELEWADHRVALAYVARLAAMAEGDRRAAAAETE